MKFILKNRKNRLFLIFLHGWAGRWQSWLPIIEQLKKDFSILALDLPGFGENKLTRPFTIFDYAEYISNLLKKERIRKAVVIGHSFGGAVAASLTIKRPFLVEKLVLIDASAIRNPKKTFTKVLAKLGKVLFSLPIINLFFSKTRLLFYRLMKLEKSDYYQIGNNKMLKKTFSLVIGEDLTERLSEIKTPTLIIWGEKDREAPLTDGQKINRLIKNSRLIIFPKAGHFPYLEDREKFCSELINFINGT